MSDRDARIADSRRRGCPTDVELHQFDVGSLPPGETERLSDHMADCETCSSLLAAHQEETWVMAKVLTPGYELLEEAAFTSVRHELLAHPEAISLGDLDLAETRLSTHGRETSGNVSRSVGPYEIVNELGRGAMGIVYRARHVNLKRDAALKTLHPRLVANREIVQRFYREMEAFGQLRDPHIVEAYDAGQWRDVHFLAMEFVDGTDTSRLCAYFETLSTPNACEIVRQAALGLETARRHKMVHRDIKPSNLMVDRDGVVKILDLGLAFFRMEGIESPRHAEAVGTADYMAPEQWQGSPRIDVRADIYSLGCTLYRFLAGQPPFHDAPDDGVSKLQAHRSRSIPHLLPLRGDVSKNLQELIERMLAKTPSDRIGSPREVADALLPFCDGSNLAALVDQCNPAPDAVTPTSRHTADTVAKGTSATSQRIRRRRWITSSAALTAALIALAAIVIRVTDKGTLEITVNQPQARIEVGSRGDTTADAGESVTIRLPRGEHEVKISKDGFAPVVQTIEISRGQNTPVRVALVPRSSEDAPASIAEARVTPAEPDPNVLVGHEGPVNAVAISPDGTRVLTGAGDATLRLWSVESRQETLNLSGHDDAVTDVGFTPDGRRAISASKDHTARLWDLESGAQLHRFIGHSNEIMSLALSHDGTRLLTSSMDRTVRMWDAESGELLAILRGHRSWVRGVTFLPGDKFAVSCGNDAIGIVWNLQTGQMHKVLQGHTHVLSSVSTSADGRYVVTGSWDTTVRLWNVMSEQTLTVMGQHDGPVRSVTFLADDNHVLSASEDKDVRLWNPFSGECVERFSGHTGRVMDVAVHPATGLMATASADRTARMWQLPTLEHNPNSGDWVRRAPEPVIGETAAPVEPIGKWRASPHGVHSVAVSPDGKQVATGGVDTAVRVWNVETHELKRELSGPTDEVLCVEYSPDGNRLAAASKDRIVYLWELAQEETSAKSILGHQHWVTSIAFSRNNRQLLSGGVDNTIILHDLVQGTVVRKFNIANEWIRAVDLGGNRRVVAAGNSGSVRFWAGRKNARWAPVRVLGKPFQWHAIACCELSPDGKLVAAGGWGNSVRVWNTQTRKMVSQFPCRADTVYDVAWYGDSDRLLTAHGDGTMRLWNMRSGKELKRYLGHEAAVRSISLSADSTVVASTGEDGQVCVWPGRAPSVKTVDSNDEVRGKS